MGEIENNEELNINTSLHNFSSESSIGTAEKDSTNSTIENDSTDMNEYKEVDNPCVALTIIGENRLTDTEVFIRRGIRYSIKAFFSAIVLTIMNMFI